MMRRAFTTPRLSLGVTKAGAGTPGGGQEPPQTHSPSLRQHMRCPRRRQSSAATASGTSSVTRKEGTSSRGAAGLGGSKSPPSSSTPDPHTGPGSVGLGHTCSCREKGGVRRGWGAPGGAGTRGGLTRVRLHQRMEKCGAKES